MMGMTKHFVNGAMYFQINVHITKSGRLSGIEYHIRREKLWYEYTMVNSLRNIFAEFVHSSVQDFTQRNDQVDH